MNMQEVRRIFGSKIFARGEKYYREGRVLGAVKIGDMIYAQVRGNKTYRVEFDLKKKRSLCTCPYRVNCKHGVAAFLAYSNGEFFDGDAFLASLKEKSKEEILKILRELLENNPEILLEMEKGGNIFSYFEGYLSYEDAVEVGRITKKGRISKDEAWDLLEYICEHYYDFGGFYDDYRDFYYGDIVLEPLFELIEKDISRKDFDRFFELLELSDVPDDIHEYAYEVLLRNAKLFREDILNAEDMSVELRAPLLAKIGEKEKAEEIILNSNLSPQEKVGLLLEVNPELAEDLGVKFSEYHLLIEHFSKKKEYEKVITLYMASEGVGYLTEYVCDAINATGRFEVFEEILKKESTNIAFLCAIELGLRDKLIELFPKAAEEYMKRNLSRQAILDALSLIGNYLEPLIPSIEKIVEFEVAKKNRKAYEFAAELMKLIKRVDTKEYERLVENLKKKHPGIRVLWELLEEAISPC
ncbi:MAG: SWIM zinc finger family protein [Palaeococcus sp.]|uniref:SWIM zinc finger family protein n=1 Tax=Palaeococcus sp. (in: euryarchaeotes) TaxID=2820298 RepID=UPI0025FD24CA|nr:SWIM zinc finger family protein [Palaeococcus sp. (in: euryarchaeotes)]MCD6559662.1 SWIM zinc finger family protein [Palaeococcus sp. (in: euryarchaeotes)]